MISVDGIPGEAPRRPLNFRTMGQQNFLGKSNHVEHPRGFVGDLDDLAVWHRAVTDEELNAIYKPANPGEAWQSWRSCRVKLPRKL